MKTLICALILAQVTVAAALQPQIDTQSDLMADIIEGKIREYLGNYLSSSEFSIVVRPAQEMSSSSRDADSIKSSLPGAPGLVQLPGGESKSFYDTSGVLHINSDDRRPLSIDLVIDSGVEDKKFNLLRTMVPKVANLDPQRGDRISVTKGRLERPPPKEPKKDPEPNWVDSLIKFKRELSSLAMGIVAAIAVLVLMHGFLGVMAAKSKAPSKPENMRGFQGRPESVGTEKAKEATEGRLGGQAEKEVRLYQEKLSQQMFEEVRNVASAQPDKLARLLREWIHAGRESQSAMLLNIFDLKTSEAIAEFMNPGDLERLKPISNGHLDIISDEAKQLLQEVRKDLIRVSAQMKTETVHKQFGFLTRLDDDSFCALLGGLNPNHLAILSAIVTPERMALLLRDLPDSKMVGFFSALRTINSYGPEVWSEFEELLKARMEASNGIVMTPKMKNRMLLSILDYLPHTEEQKTMLERIEVADPEAAKEIRESLYFFEDILALPFHSLQALLIQVQAPTISAAVFGLSAETIQSILSALPQSAAELVSFDITNKKQFNTDQVGVARDEMVQKLRQSVNSGLIKREFITTQNSLKEAA